MFKNYLTIILITISLSGFCQKMDFLPNQNIWQTIVLDPLASQSFSHCAAAWEGSDDSFYSLMGFAFGFQKSGFLWKTSDNRKVDLGLEGSAITQFEWITVDEKIQRNILSTDFLIGVPVVWQIDNLMLRFRIYHLSAHMGDDYMIRNNITSYYKNNNNYEQFDITAAYFFKNLRFILGAGTILRASNTRKPLVFSSGIDFLLPLNINKSANLYAGFYADTKQDNDFIPSINIGVGIELGKPDRRGIKILMTYFNGPLPYSVYQGRPLQWLGAGFYIDTF